MICEPDGPKRLPHTVAMGSTHATDPINCAVACDATQVDLMAGLVHGPCMANGR